MSEPEPIPCFGGPLDGKTAPGHAMHHEVDHDGATVRYNRMKYCRIFTLYGGTEVIQTAYIFVTDIDMQMDFKITPERHDQLKWSPTEEEILMNAEAEGAI
jgi:hypothetical protein